MSAPTLVVSPQELRDGGLAVRGEAYRHLFRARRAAVGDPVRVVDGRGRAAWARIDAVTSVEARLVVQSSASANEPAVELEVWTAMPRPRRASWLVEKATELGASAVRWVDWERSVRSVSPPGIERLERVARAAVEQCHRARLPELTGPHRPAQVGAAIERGGAGWLLRPGPRAERPSSIGGRTLLIVGPEGGLTDSEVADLEAAGAETVMLGRRILRVETAAVAAVTTALSAVASPVARAGDEVD